MALESWEPAKVRAKEARERPPREQIRHERPGTVLRGSPITVTCECGETREHHDRQRVEHH